MCVKKGVDNLANYRSQQKTAYIRQKVCSSAAQLFLKEGYSSATIKDISALSGISVSSIMKVMKSKENILAELVGYVLENQFAATKVFLGGLNYDPILFYAAETTLQLYMAESSEAVRSLYAVAYSLPKTTEIIQNTLTNKLEEFFAAYLPNRTREDFYLKEIASGGIMRAFMAHPCTEEFTIEKKVKAFLEASFPVYHFSEEKLGEALIFVSQFDYPTLAKKTIEYMLEKLENTYP